jgi:transposase InsO family protein
MTLRSDARNHQKSRSVDQGLNRQRWHTRHDLRIAIVTWTERTYHRRRRQQRLGRLTPIEFETIMTTPALQAA